MRLVTMMTAGLLLALAGAHGASAQERPTFSGSWTLSESSGGMGGGAAMRRGGGGGTMTRGSGGGMIVMRGGLGQAATIVHGTETLEIHRSGPGGQEMRSVYQLDGSPSRNTLSVGGNELELESTARWDGATLVITSSGAFGDETTMSLSLNEDGNLVVETVRSGGATGGGEPMQGLYTRR